MVLSGILCIFGRISPRSQRRIWSSKFAEWHWQCTEFVMVFVTPRHKNLWMLVTQRLFPPKRALFWWTGAIVLLLGESSEIFFALLPYSLVLFFSKRCMPTNCSLRERQRSDLHTTKTLLCTPWRCLIASWFLVHLRLYNYLVWGPYFLVIIFSALSVLLFLVPGISCVLLV